MNCTHRMPHCFIVIVFLSEMNVENFHHVVMFIHLKESYSEFQPANPTLSTHQRRNVAGVVFVCFLRNICFDRSIINLKQPPANSKNVTMATVWSLQNHDEVKSLTMMAMVQTPLNAGVFLFFFFFLFYFYFASLTTSNPYIYWK